MNDQTEIPAGYLKKANGHLVPESAIKPIDQERDALVKDIVGAAKQLSRRIADFKLSAFGDIAAFVQLSAEQYGAKIGGNKGNVTLISFDGRYKVQRAIAEHITFDERLLAAKVLIDECVQDWISGARKEVIVLINDAFRVDSSGNIRTANVLALHRLEIDDDRWKQAMRAISESLQVVGSKSYVRIYERIGSTDQWAPISLDIAGV